MWQSSGKYVPTVEQLLEVAPGNCRHGLFRTGRNQRWWV